MFLLAVLQLYVRVRAALFLVFQTSCVLSNTFVQQSDGWRSFFRCFFLLFFPPCELTIDLYRTTLSTYMTDIIVQLKNVSNSLEKFQPTNEAGNWLSDVAGSYFWGFPEIPFLILDLFLCLFLCVLSLKCSLCKYVKKFTQKWNFFQYFIYLF